MVIFSGNVLRQLPSPIADSENLIAVWPSNCAAQSPSTWPHKHSLTALWGSNQRPNVGLWSNFMIHLCDIYRSVRLLGRDLELKQGFWIWGLQVLNIGAYILIKLLGPTVYWNLQVTERTLFTHTNSVCYVQNKKWNNSTPFLYLYSAAYLHVCIL